MSATARSRSPHDPPARVCGLVDVHGAVITPLRSGPAFSETGIGPRAWLTGAVHDDAGRLVTESIQPWAGNRRVPISVDPERREPGPVDEHLEGRWIYGGHWETHFGHFLVETLTNLWPARDEAERSAPLRGIVAHHRHRGSRPDDEPDRGVRVPRLKDWQRELLELSGYGGLPVRLVDRVPVRVDDVVVPERPVTLKAWARPEAVATWRRISEAVGSRGPERRVFLSRSAMNTRRRAKQGPRVRSDDAWDDHLDRRFARAGYAVVHTEELSIRDQVALVRGARVVAGSSGSALHLAAFADPGTRVLEVGDRRWPDRPSLTQRLLDAACGHRPGFVPHGDERALEQLLDDEAHDPR